jgi:hypothetical protein
MLNWYVVHRKNKRLPPVAVAFKSFLLTEGAAILEKITRFEHNRLRSDKGGARIKASR